MIKILCMKVPPRPDGLALSSELGSVFDVCLQQVTVPDQRCLHFFVYIKLTRINL